MIDLVTKLSELLQEKDMKLVSAESCTGGMISVAITDVAGSSSVLDRGFVTYSNNSKEEMLGVSSNILLHYGAVSSQCADAMVLGALNNSPADIAVSVTGIAGPGGAREGKPVGLVYIGICVRGKEPVITENHFSGDRNVIRKSACEKALSLLIEAALAV
ncbi:MAG: CinA family protein [Alphaproteobacteria bacterium]